MGRAAHPPGYARCGAGAASSAINYQPFLGFGDRTGPHGEEGAVLHGEHARAVEEDIRVPELPRVSKEPARANSETSRAVENLPEHITNRNLFFTRVCMMNTRAQ